ncbi:sensor histidine kinase [Salirhabdus sp. Marseille-P4669]|uniref:sensor histidine kinase n=1 Tax=Salirhabdus sp. Marseille-P4669 TaxID=2042310 RepID=UPI000C7A04D2|nr:sensor histidine kinase [Salirhabdus sp. Marseille-P4669]
MSHNQTERKMLNKILEDMLAVVSNSKDEVFEIGEQSRKEYEEVELELQLVKEKVVQIIEEGDRLERRVKQFRIRLSEVSKNFKNYSEEEVKNVYNETHMLQSELLVLREKEDQLRSRRNELERRLLSLSETVERAENLIGKISVVLTYLTDDLKGVYDTLESAREKEEFGLKIIDAQEEERRKLSREIHDGPAQSLANVMLRSELIERTFRERGIEEAIQEVRSVKQMVKSALFEVRRIIYDLRPMALDDIGVIPTLRRYLKTVEEYSKNEIKFVAIGEERRLDPKYETALFRLVQEAVQNAVKHANATLIQVNFELTPRCVNIIVVDNGVGFNTDEKTRSSFGLIGMKERVEILNGELEISSKEKEGTKIAIKVPLL